MKSRISFWSVALAVCTATPLAAQTVTTWDFPVKVTAADGALTKSSGCEGCADSGAHSGTQIAGDGYTEFVAPALTRLFAGLGADLSASTASPTINYAFSLWPSGTWEVRELGVYRKEGTYAAGDRFRVAVESGAVVYRRNGAIVYTSKIAPVYPLGLDVTLYALGASISQATIASTVTTPVDPPPPPPPPPSGGGAAAPMPTATGPYLAVTDRQAYAKPALPVPGPAGSAFADPIFGTSIRRITDGLTRPGTANRSYRTPSSPHQNAWSVNSRYFYVMGSGGVGPIPYAFDATSGAASRIQPSATGDGGIVLKFYIEPQFSYVDDAIIYGSFSGTGSTRRTIDQYDFSTAAYTRLLDLDALAPGLTDTYIGGVASSGGPVERIEAFFGGTSQDRHRYVVVFDRANPQNRQMIDTVASTINGQPSPVTLNFKLHHVMIDRSGRYVMLYSTSADQAAPRNAAQEYLWDLQTGAVTELGTAALPYGHDAFGYGVYVNKDCCTTSTWDAGQWQFRSLASPLAPRDLIKTVITPKEIYLSDHTTWNNARADRLTPVISGLYRFGTNTTAWRPWDDEILAIQTDAAPGTESTVWRFAHHRTNVADDRDATRTGFWYQPHPNVSPDGKWILFTSNWEKTLGVDTAAEPGVGARQDVFLLALRPARIPVVITTSALPSVRATLAYSATLGATGGTGAFVWSATGLPAGLALDAPTGAISGTPTTRGTSTVTVSVADAADAGNVATVSLTIRIDAAPVAIGAAVFASGRATIPYAAALQATGGTGAFQWTVSAGTLPAGVTLDGATGAMTGTPSAAGTYSFTATVTDAEDATNTASAPFTIDIGASPVTIAAAALPCVRATLGYGAALQGAGGSGAYSWAITGGSLPAGLTLDAATGAIGGTPSAAGSNAFTVSVTDAGDASNVANAAFTITIMPSPVQVPAAALLSGRATIAYAGTLQASGGTGAFQWTIAAGALPSGVTLDASTGALAGTPSAAGTFNFTTLTTDTGDVTNTATQSFTIAVGTPPVAVTTTTIAAGRQRVAYSATLQAAGGSGTVSWSAVTALPGGLSLNASTGVISGTPTTAGSYSVTVRATDTSDSSNSATSTLTFAIAAAIKIVSPRTLSDATAGVAYTYTVLAANVVGTAKWNLQGGSLPPGMTLNATTGVITGTCATRGTYSFNARVKDSNTDDTLTLTIVVK